MPVTFTPVENNRIMTFKITDPWQTEELVGHYAAEYQYFNNSKGKIHTIFDLAAMRTVPPTALRARSGPGLDHPNSGYVVLVGGHPLARALAELIERLLRAKRFKFVASYEDGIAFLKQQIIAEDATNSEKAGVGASPAATV